MRFKRLPVWVSKADIVAYLKLSPTDAQALIDGSSRCCLIDGVEKISKYQLQTPPYPDLIQVMRLHPSLTRDFPRMCEGRRALL